MKKIIGFQEYIAIPTLDELRAKGIRGAQLLGVQYRCSSGVGVHRIFERIKSDTCHTVTRIIDVDLV